MRRGRVPQNDNLFRHVISPTSFNKKGFAPIKFLTIFDEGTNKCLASVAWQRFVPSDSYVHSYGCRLSKKQNEKLLSNGTLQKKGSRVYCGAFQLRAMDIRNIGLDNSIPELLSVDAFHEVEDGEIAHTSLEFTFAEDVCDKEAAKTAIYDRLWNMASGPARHVCSCDEELQDHPLIKIPVAPRGEYEDKRSFIVVKWHLIRFAILNWFWQKFPRHFYRYLGGNKRVVDVITSANAQSDTTLHI